MIRETLGSGKSVRGAPERVIYVLTIWRCTSSMDFDLLVRMGVPSCLLDVHKHEEWQLNITCICSKQCWHWLGHNSPWVQIVCHSLGGVRLYGYHMSAHPSNLYVCVCMYMYLPEPYTLANSHSSTLDMLMCLAVNLYGVVYLCLEWSMNHTLNLGGSKLPFLQPWYRYTGNWLIFHTLSHRYICYRRRSTVCWCSKVKSKPRN